jgi:hypothetical protein
MNRLILKYKYPLTFVILAVLAWVVYRRISLGGSDLITFAVAAVTIWGLGTFLFIYFWPRIVLRAYRRASLVEGFDKGPIPVNTLYTQPQALFADPFAPLPPRSSKLLSYGTNRDTLYTGGVLDLSKGPRVLHVPDMAGRYYAVQFTDPSDGTNFAYVGTRTTGTQAGDYLISGPSWKGTVPQGMTQISSPNNSVLVIGRVFVASDSDLPTAYGLAKQIQLAPLSQWQSGQ